MTLTHGFNAAQVLSAAEWLGVRLSGHDPRSLDPIQPEIVAQLSEEKLELTDQISTLLSSRRASQPSIIRFVQALNEEMLNAISKGEDLKQSDRGGKFLKLEASTHCTSELLTSACEKVGLGTDILYQFFHNQSLYLHDDGQIYHESWNKFGNLISYSGCPKPEYEVSDVRMWEFSPELHQVIFDDVWVLPVERDEQIPEGILPLIAGFPGSIDRPQHFREAGYLCTMRPHGSLVPEGLTIRDVLFDQSNKESLFFDTRFRGPFNGIKKDIIVDGNFAPDGAPGALLEPTEREGIYYCVSYPLRIATITRKTQIGCGTANTRLEPGEMVFLSGDTNYSDYVGRPGNLQDLRLDAAGKMKLYLPPSREHTPRLKQVASSFMAVRFW